MHRLEIGDVCSFSCNGPVHNGPLALSQTPGGKDKDVWVCKYMDWGGGNFGHHMARNQYSSRGHPVMQSVRTVHRNHIDHCVNQNIV